MSETVGSRATQHSSLRDYVATARRRKWIIVQAVVLLPAAALAFSLHQQKLFRAHAEVLLSQQNLATQLNGLTDPTQYQQADRLAQTQADLARVPEVARQTLDAVGLRNRSTQNFLSQSSATASPNANLLDLSVTDYNPSVAKELATAYATQFARYRAELDTAPLQKAKREVDQRRHALAAAGDTNSGIYQELVSKGDTLDTMIALQTGNAVPVKAATGADQVQPRPVRNGILGLALGIVLGMGLAFLWEALDTRVRSADEIGERLGMPLLARLPEPPRRLRKPDRLVMLDEPRGVHAEAFRMLRTNLEFVRLNGGVRTIVVTSAVEREGKSTTAANLALALARAGQHVVLVDLDLRRPSLHQFFGAETAPGVTQVALGKVTLPEALVPVALAELEPKRKLWGSSNGSGNGNGYGELTSSGTLHLVTAGPLPPNAGEFVGSTKLGSILDHLRANGISRAISLGCDFDTVLIDSPPLLKVGDALTLSKHADGLLLVTRLNLIRRPMINELHRLLASAPVEKLGFIVTAAQDEAGYGYAGAYYDGYAPPRHREREVVR
jgi:succinoglycan biosynthesis transport protein ExoP